MFGDDEYTKLLIHSDDTDGSTTFTDSSDSAHTITANGDVHHEVDQKKFGATSIHLDGTGDFLSLPVHSDFNYGADDFTIDLWARLSSVAVSSSFYGQIDDTSNRIQFGYFQPSSFIQFFVNDGGTVKAYYGWGWSPTVNIWYHICLVRTSSGMHFFVDGIKLIRTVGTTDIGSSSMPVLSTAPKVGIANYSSVNYYPRGYLDEIRISKGIARWTENFTPPTLPYSAVPAVSDRYIPPFPGFPVPHNTSFLPGLSASGLIRQNRKGFFKAF